MYSRAPSPRPTRRQSTTHCSGTGWAEHSPAWAIACSTLAPKHLGEGKLVEQIPIAGALPGALGEIDPAAWYHHMQMGMVAQAPAVSMQHCGHAHLAPQVLGVEFELLKRLGGGAKQRLIEGALMLPGELTKLRRQGEGDQEVVHGQELLAPARQPLGGLVILAAWAAAMAAGAWLPVQLTAVAAAAEHLPGLGGTAAGDRLQSALMAGQQLPAVASLHRLAIALNQAGEPHRQSFLRSTRREPTRRLSSAEVACSVVSVRWA